MQCRYCGRQTQIIDSYQGFPLMRHVPGPVCDQCISSPKRRRMYQAMVSKGFYDLETRSLIHISPPVGDSKREASNGHTNDLQEQ